MCHNCIPVSLPAVVPSHAATVKMETTQGEFSVCVCVCQRERGGACTWAFLLSVSKSCYLFAVSAPPSTRQPHPSPTHIAMTSGMPTTEPLPPTAASAAPEINPATLAFLRTRRLNGNQCFRYAYGTFMGNITIIGGWESVVGGMNLFWGRD